MWAAQVGLALLVAVQGVAAPARCNEVPIDARYTITVAGLPVAEIALVLAPAEEGLAGRLVMQSVGLASLWSGARSELRAFIARAKEGIAVPRLFEAHYAKRDRERRVRIQYDQNGSVREAEVTTLGRIKPTDVPEELQRGTVDPLTAFARLRDWLSEALAGRAPPQTEVAVFDGRKRLDLEVRLLGRVERVEAGRESVELSARLIGRFGFDPDDSFIELPNGDQPRPLRVLVEAGETLLPLRIDVPDRPSGPVIALVRNCRTTRCPPAG